MSVAGQHFGKGTHGTGLGITGLKSAVLIGTSGVFAGEVFKLEHLKPTVVGRSRSAEISVKRTAFYRDQSPEERERDEVSQTISAKHFQVTLFNLRSIEIKNLSVNGTFVDGKPIEKPVIVTNLAQRSHEITFGKNGSLRLELQG